MLTIPFLRSRPAQTAFADHLLGWVRRKQAFRSATVDHGEFRIDLGIEGRLFNLHNLYSDYCRAPFWRRNQVVRHYVDSLVTTTVAVPESREQVEASLMPAIRDLLFPQYLLQQTQGAGSGGLDLPYRTLADFYLFQPILDLPATMASVTRERLSSCGITDEAAFQGALDNLKALDSPFEQISPGLWASRQGDCYDAARLLLVDRLRRLPDEGAPVVVPVHRNLLLIADSGLPAALNRLAELAEENAVDPRHIGLVPLILDQETWRIYLPPADDAHIPIHRLLRLGYIGPYAEQKKQLEQDLTAKGEDVFVASYTVTADEKTGRCRSHCVWTEAPAFAGLLPRTDVIALIGASQGQRPVFYRWEDLVPRCGHLLLPTADLLPRWSARGFPEAELLKAIAPA